MSNMAPVVPSSNVIDRARHWASTNGEGAAFSFLRGGEELAGRLTFAALDDWARRVAGKLQSWNMGSERALLLLPSGLEFVTGFLGCLYAGVIPVTAYPPNGPRPLSRLGAIIDDADVRVVMTTGDSLEPTRQAAKDLPGLARCQWMAVDGIEPAWSENWSEPVLDARSLAFLQYTSGSTATPKGVMVSHGNLADNLRVISDAWKTSPDSVAVCWLPLFHDLGLIGNIIHAIHVGFHCVLMSPESFIRRPSRWLRAITRYSATLSGAPNFAFDLCVRKVASEEKTELDLSNWAVCYNGSEQVRPGTLDRFSSTFAECGFQADAFFPGYGLAEATLLVASRPAGRPPNRLSVDRGQIELRVVASCAATGPQPRRDYMSCGVAEPSFDLRIVDPDSRRTLPEDRVGEIWLKGPSITEGYWKNPVATAASRGRMRPNDDGPYLRTGDLGFLHGGELFITGRLKDVIIIRGRNYFAEDIEATVERSHDAFRPGCGVAFSVHGDDEEERLIVVHEIRRAWQDADLGLVSEAARKAIGADHEIAPWQVLLVEQGDVSKTTSGKLARTHCRRRFLARSFRVLHADGPGSAANAPAELEPLADASNELTLLIEDMARYLADELRIPASRIPRVRPVMTLGLDSLQVQGLLSHLQDVHGLDVPLSLIHAGSSLHDIAVHLAEKRTGTGANPLDVDHPSSFTDWFLARRHSQLGSGKLGGTHRDCYFRPFGNSDGVSATVDGRRLIMLGSNNYLGLTADERVREAAAKAAREHGPSMTGSRLLNGSTDLHRRLEQDLARFVGREDALVFTTGYQAILGMITGVMNQETILVLDERSHACAIDAARIAMCPVRYFKHNQPEDLRRKLANAGEPTLVLVDGVYSVEGDYCCLAEIHELCAEFGAWLAIDDAHGLGVAGETGRGTEEHFARLGAANLLAGTFSKSLASIGGWVAGDAGTIDWIRFHGRTMLFSAAMPPPALAAAAKALEILESEPALVRRAKENGRFWRDGLRQLGARVGDSDTPIVPIRIGDAETCLALASDLFEAGVYVNPFIYPAVQDGQSMLRTSVTSQHTREHLTEALRIFREVGTRRGVF